MNIQRFAFGLQHLIGLLTIAKVAQLIKVSFVLGSFTIFFSATDSLLPLTGYAGMPVLFIITVLYKLLFLTAGSSLFWLLQGVPTFFAGYYLGSPSFLSRVIVPAFMIAAFLSHPVGNQAWAYTLYWLLPIAFYWIKSKNLFIEAVGSTLVAHAVGSVIWIYTHATTVSFWHALIPFVTIERLILAGGMVLWYLLYQQSVLLYKNWSLGVRAKTL